MATWDGNGIVVFSSYNSLKTPKVIAGNNVLLGTVPVDAVPPVVTIISPTPGIAPGSPGGFPADYNAAKVTPIILTVTDVDPGVALIVLTVKLGTNKKELIYDGAFNEGFTGSSVSAIADGFQFSVIPDGGWTKGPLLFEAKPIDLAGNLTP